MKTSSDCSDKLEYPFIQARNYTPLPAGQTRPIDLIVIHDMEAPEGVNTAENVARWFAGPDTPRASAHFQVDADHVWQSVRICDVAWHAPGANNNGIGIEHAGYAKQTAAEWADPNSQRMLVNSANLVAQLALDYNIPVEFVDAQGLLEKKRGITTHAAVSEAFKKSDHTDPGPNFPMEQYLELVRAGMGTGSSSPGSLLAKLAGVVVVAGIVIASAVGIASVVRRT